MNEYKDDLLREYLGETEESAFLTFVKGRDEASEWKTVGAISSIGIVPMPTPMDAIQMAKEEGIPLETLDEAAQETGSGLVIDLANTKTPVGLSAIPSLRERAGLTVGGLKKLRPAITAEATVLNLLLTHTAGGAKVKIGDGMVRAVVSTSYAVVPADDILEYAKTEYFGQLYPKAEFKKGFYTHELVQAVWSLDYYRSEFLAALEAAGLAKGYEPVLVIESSDVAQRSISLRPCLMKSGKTDFLVPMTNAINTPHLGENGIYERLEAAFDMVLKSFQDASEGVNELANIAVKHGYNALVSALKLVQMPKEQAIEAAEKYKAAHGEGPCTALDVYIGVCEAYNFVVRDFPNNKLKCFRASDATSRVVKARWTDLDKEFVSPM